MRRRLAAGAAMRADGRWWIRVILSQLVRRLRTRAGTRGIAQRGWCPPMRAVRGKLAASKCPDIAKAAPMSSPRFAATPEPPYYTVIFASQRREGDDGYASTAERMVELAAQQPGFLGVESVRDADGFGITVSYWASAQSTRRGGQDQ